MSDYETLLIERDGGVVQCMFNRPEVRNALNHQMVRDIRALLTELSAEALPEVLIFAGSDKAFVSGADISELRDRRRDAAFERINTELFAEIEKFAAPTIAAVRGWALGGGCELAMACDLRIAGEGARFGQPEVGLGIIPGAGGCYRLPRLVGLGRARELVFTGRIIDAAEAADIGLVNRVVPDATVLDAARELADAIAKNSSLAVRMAKTMLNGASDMSTDALMALEATSQAVLFDDPEKDERMTAFLEKRSAKASKESS
ncbi:MAG: enoyl-CoA hydratase-related protein [Planctomycetota bacterium]|jgi:enoyl-CoA hydratase|nr:enoyl-CoA hydratase-related protein [Planctomycetota bacterium]